MAFATCPACDQQISTDEDIHLASLETVTLVVCDDCNVVLGVQ